MLRGSYTPPWWFRDGLVMTLHVGLKGPQIWERFTVEPPFPYREQIFYGADEVPIYGWVAQPEQPRGTIIGTYGITGSLSNQWFLNILGRKAFAQGYAVVLFDWRAHGKTAELSPTLTSDGLSEGEDFVRIAAQAKAMGCPAPFWFTGYSLSGQLALWGIKEAQEADAHDWGIASDAIAGAAVICPNLDSNRSLSYLMRAPLGRFLDRAIAKSLKQLAQDIARAHPGFLDPAAIARANTIWGFDHELVIHRLGFDSVEAYYAASSPLPFLPELTKPTLILYAADDPMFDPAIVPDLQEMCDRNSSIDLWLTPYGGHVGYISNQACQRHFGDADPWWAWNRVLEWLNQSTAEYKR